MSEPTYRIAQALHASRAAVGLKKYGQHLSADSPGCMLVHALEESADKTNYLIAEVQRRRKALEVLFSMANAHRHEAHIRRSVEEVMDLLGGWEMIATYGEILGTVAENATVAPEPPDAAKVDPRKIVAEAIADLSAEQALTGKRDDTLDTVEMALRNIHAGAMNYFFVKENAAAGLEAIEHYKDKLCGAAPDPRDEALRVADAALESCEWNVANHPDGHQMQFQLCAEKARQARAAIRESR